MVSNRARKYTPLGRPPILGPLLLIGGAVLFTAAPPWARAQVPLVLDEAPAGEAGAPTDTGRSASPAGTDTVLLKTDGGGTVRLTGSVIDFSGEGLDLRDTTGVRRSFPAQRVKQIEPARIGEHAEADRRYRQRRWEEAIPLYRQARQREPRGWVRRMITARLVRCYDNADRPLDAAREFLDVLVAADPQTPYFDVIPLAWVPRRASGELERAARGWLDGGNPVAALVGASHLLVGQDGSRAVAKLESLTHQSERRVAQAALVQSWRRDVFSASVDELRRRERLLETFPPAVRAGGYYLLGTAWAQRERWEDACVDFLRPPVLYQDQYRLAARCLSEAARCREKLGDEDGAQTLYNELQTRYADTPEGQEVARRREAQPSG